MLAAIGRSKDSVFGQPRASKVGLRIGALREAEHRARHCENVLEGLPTVAGQKEIAALRVEVPHEEPLRVLRIDSADEKGAIGDETSGRVEIALGVLCSSIGIEGLEGR